MAEYGKTGFPDFSESSPAAAPCISPPPGHVNFDVESGQPRPPTDNDGYGSGNGRGPLRKSSSTQSDPEISLNHPPSMSRRRNRTNTAKSAIEFMPLRPQWQAGQEPGLDPSKPNGGRAQLPTFHEDCQITVVDISEDEIYHFEFNNAQLIQFLHEKQEPWVKCRWINVNGLSWDVIQALGQYKKLHRLAMEDLINTSNRTKADWYSDHTYMVLTLQKLIHMHRDAEDSDSDDGDTDSIRRPKRGRLSKFAHNLLSGSNPKKKYNEKNMVAGVHNPANSFVTGHTESVSEPHLQNLKTLQRYHGGPNKERMEFMEKHSPLTSRKLAVSAEQVSIFLTNDNTVISFFESSADDIESPILERLRTPDTILRRSCDASMIVQAILDAIIDLAIPIATAYQDVIGDLELDVLTKPELKHTTSLYVVTSEIFTFRSLVNPIVNLINALRDHKSVTLPVPNAGPRALSSSTTTSVKMSPMAQTYLGDVEDHIILITESLDQMRRSCDNMIDLIFNTMSALQNETLQQLTNITILFLPMTFLTGYFGMNIEPFPALEHGTSYFWKIAVPVAIVTSMFLMRSSLMRWGSKVIQRRGITRRRKGRLERETEAHRAAEAKRRS
ncbi:uncharacterized protein L3040_003955 [Drepanopeziza brunnea f. sp. 'multigermtubi']|uniref:uncharacterized protein n=1 Tax=Drepanopeziza brunnea f. sp. 'multigermtubi' TaxID=698441 RepID=UPI00239DBC49|nr:hypothetical protein L3040_003955 [Drepanopeziza brunnea f. sp. 'multigermtubi']